MRPHASLQQGPRRRLGATTPLTLALVLALVAVAPRSWPALADWGARLWSARTSSPELQPEEARRVALYASAAPGVVGITAHFPGDRESESGAGVLWDEDGHLVTNLHLVEGASHLRIRLHDGTMLEARAVGEDPRHDLALLKIQDPPALQPLPLGPSAPLRVGQDVYAIGSPFGLDHSFSHGILSGKGREVICTRSGLPLYDLLQTDAAILPGNSGGPLLDSAGHWVGLNTAVAGEEGSYGGVGFAIPSSTLRRIVPQLIQRGRAEWPTLGIRVDPSGRERDEMRRILGDRPGGLFIEDVHAGGAAALAGLRPTRLETAPSAPRLQGDLLHAVDGQRVDHPEDLRRILQSCRAGQTVQLVVTRWDASCGRPLTLQARLQDRPVLPPPPLGPHG